MQSRFGDVEACPHCGRALVGDEADPKLHRTVERVVRPGHKYGHAAAGARVTVERRETEHPSVVSATMSLTEAADAAKAARAKTKAPPPPNRLKEMVERGQAGAEAATRQAIERGRAAERAAELAASVKPAVAAAG